MTKWENKKQLHEIWDVLFLIIFLYFQFSEFLKISFSNDVINSKGQLHSFVWLYYGRLLSISNTIIDDIFMYLIM